MKRNGQIILAANCLLNVNAKIEGLAAYPAVSRIIPELISMGYGIIQLPCIEQAVFGIRRWGIVHSQCDFPAFRRRCRELLEPVVDQVEDFARNGYTIRAVLGVDGSPTCGVSMRPEGDWCGEVGYEYGLDSKIGSLSMEEGMGTMMEVLSQMFKERQLSIPFLAIDESCDDMSAEQLLGQDH